MKRSFPATALLCCALLPAAADCQTLLFSDSFDVADTTNFDGAPLVLEDGVTNRRSGTLAETVFLRSALQQQQHISNQQVSLRGGRLRFHDAGGWYNWAGGTANTDILAAGGLRVEFDWVPTDTTATNWVAFNVGFPGTGEPPTRVNNQPTDFGILFRNNGGTERFDNGANLGPGGAFPATATSRHVTIDYAFDSFANGTIVRMRASVDGVRVSENQFSWDDNNGELYLEIETNQVGSLIDNYIVSTIPAELDISLDTLVFSPLYPQGSFSSAYAQGQPVGTLTAATFSLGAEDATFELVAGEGSDNNDLFQIGGNELQVGDFDFTGENSFDGAQYFIRVSGTGVESEQTGERAFVLTIIKDDDGDGILDSWELFHAGNLTDLNGLASGPGPGARTGDFDGDGIPDLEEYNHSQGAYPDISPIFADTDGDGLTDAEEIAGAGNRPPTNPTLVDTDGDGLNDFMESNTTIFAGDEDTGSDPTLVDSDGDGARDGFEVAGGGDPNNIDSRPELSPAVKLVRIEDEANVDISAGKTYTHLVSGGGPATVNGVAFDVLDLTDAPENFTWDIFGGGDKANIAPINNGDWQPGTSGVSGQGLLDLLGGFTHMTFAEPGGVQTYTLGGLTVGQTYELRLYTRLWDTEGSGRPIDFVFTNGSTVEHPFGALLLDRPALMLQSENLDVAYYISYTYVAESTELIVNASVHSSAATASGSHHLYGLTNEALPQPSGELRVTGVTRSPAGNIVIDFLGEPDTTYEVTKSPDLATPFGPLTEPVLPTTNASGVGQATVPASEASEPSEFYRIEE